MLNFTQKAKDLLATGRTHAIVEYLGDIDLTARAPTLADAVDIYMDEVNPGRLSDEYLLDCCGGSNDLGDDESPGVTTSDYSPETSDGDFAWDYCGYDSDKEAFAANRDHLYAAAREYWRLVASRYSLMELDVSNPEDNSDVGVSMLEAYGYVTNDEAKAPC